MSAAVEAAARAVCKAHREWSVSRHSLDRRAEQRAQVALRERVEQLDAALRLGDPSPITIRRTGAGAWPWEVRCSQHPGERTYTIPEVGAAAINTRGIGNRTWRIAFEVALRHWIDLHTCKGCGGPKDRPGALIGRWCPVHDREVGVG